jgi:hypothetical protein
MLDVVNRRLPTIAVVRIPPGPADDADRAIQLNTSVQPDRG